MLLDPDLARIVGAMPARPDVSAVPDSEYAAVREAAHAYFALAPSTSPDDVDEAEYTVPDSSQPVRVYRPAHSDSALPALVWIHGGGFTLGMLDADDERCRGYVRAAQCAVVSVEYRLAPEHPFPAAPDDCWAAVMWTVEHAQELRIDASRLAIGGASAGGCLAAAMTLRARQAEGPSLAYQMLVYPALDDRLETRSSRDKTDVPIFSRRDAVASWRRYLSGRESDVPADAAPSRCLDLTGLPPAFVLTAEHDPLRDEGNDYALRLQAGGVSTELHQYPGAFHGFESIGLDAPIVRRAIREQGRALRNALHDPPRSVDE